MNARPTGYEPDFGSKSVDWDRFKLFLNQRYVKKVAKYYFLYAKRYASSLFKEDFSILKTLRDSERNYVLCSLSALSKFLGCYKLFKNLREAYDISWSRGNRDLLIIKRILKRNNSEEIIGWIEIVTKKLPRLKSFIDLLLSCGIRYNEGLTAYNLIKKLYGKGELEEYYDDQILQHYKYPRLFIRRTKKLFLSICLEEIIDNITKSEIDHLTHNSIKMKLQRKKIPLRFGDIREYWASVMTRYLSQPEIDFLQGRISATVFMTNYFNPLLIKDLKTRTLKGVQQLLNL